MTNEEASIIIGNIPINGDECYSIPEYQQAKAMAIKALEQQPCEMAVNEYRNRLMDAFHNADCDELIAVVVRPEESEFKQLEWLLKNHYHKSKSEYEHDHEVVKAYNDGQAYILEKVKEEIKNAKPVYPDRVKIWSTDTIIGIIDKYLQEVENADSN